jgi:hypothetical protein
MTRWIVGIVVATVLLTTGLIVVVASSSDSEDEAAAAPPTVLGAPDEEAFAELRDCLEEQGVDPPEPGLDGGPVPGAGGPRGDGSRPEPSEEMLEAIEACREVLPTPPGAPGNAGGPGFRLLPQD